MNFKWPLADNNFNLCDRLKICKFFLTYSNRWTQDKYVREYENLLQTYVGCKYAVFVHSGSAANQLISQFIKDKLVKSGEWPKRNKVIVNAVTWQTNISVFTREGFEPVFIDVNLDDFCLDYNTLEKYLEDNQETVACVFPTAVLGFTPDINRLKDLSFKYPKIKFALDACENLLGMFECRGNSYNLCLPFTSSTSCFIAHQISTGQEGGLIFTNSQEEYEYFILSRAHGLLRNLSPYLNKLEPTNYEENIGYTRIDSLRNPLVDKQFDFQTLSSNYRNSDIAAFCGILDFKRVEKYKKHREDIYKCFKDNLHSYKYYLPPYREEYKDIAFCLPIILRDKDKVQKVKNLLDKLGIERRSFISGNMLRQLPYQKYGDYRQFPNAEYLNEFGMYIGINMWNTKKHVEDICRELNKL